MANWIKKVNLEFKKTTYVDFSLIMANSDGQSICEAIKRREMYASAFNELLSPSNILCIPTTPGVACLRPTTVNKVNEFNYDRLRPLVALSSIGRLPQITLPLEQNGPPIGISLLTEFQQDIFLLNTIKKIMANTKEIQPAMVIPPKNKGA